MRQRPWGLVGYARLQPEPRGSRESASVIRVVIADDQPLVRAGISMLVNAEQDIDVVAEAVDGQDALVQIRAQRPDVVLMDVRMPGTDGVAATRVVIEEGLTAQSGEPVRVIILTTFHLDDYVHAHLHAGPSGILPKHAPPASATPPILGRTPAVA